MTAAPTDLTGIEVARLIGIGCLSKRPYRGSSEARTVAAARPSPAGHPIRAYWCPWAAPLGLRSHWHIGHLPSVERLELIACAIRWCGEHGAPGGLDPRSVRRAQIRAGLR